MNSQHAHPIDTYLSEGLLNQVFPAASLLVSKQGHVIYRKNMGCADDSLFDIASLTKPFATATLIQKLLEEKRIRLHQPITTFLKEFDTKEKRLMTFQHLLDHTSGLPAWRPYFETLAQEKPKLMATWEARQWYVEKIASEPLENGLGTKRVYSDLSFIILGVILENILKTKLEILFKRQIVDPLDLKASFFRRVGSETPFPLEKFLPTGQPPSTFGRTYTLCGEVNDDNAYALGGVAGHAGVFSTVDDLNIFLNFIHSQKSKNEIRLGWDTPTQPSQSGTHFSPNSIGHLGYTGCSMWIDFDQDFHVIFLTNRTQISYENDRIKTFRPKLHDLIYKTLIIP